MGKANLYERFALFGDGEGIWEDLRFPANGINLPGSSADPTRDDVTGSLVFSATQDNVIAGVAQMPHAWAPESTVSPHLHLICPNGGSGNMRWKFEYNRG